jgi:WD40 repeat protein
LYLRNAVGRYRHNAGRRKRAADGGAGGHAEVVRDVSWHPFKPEIVTTAWDGTCRLWTFAQHHELDRKRALNEYSFRARPRPTRNNVVDDDDDDDEEYQG